MTMADTKVYIAMIANAKAISKADMLLFLSLRLVYTFFRIGTMSKQSTMLKNKKRWFYGIYKRAQYRDKYQNNIPPTFVNRAFCVRTLRLHTASSDVYTYHPSAMCTRLIIEK